jgi:hypothetical protein
MLWTLGSLDLTVHSGSEELADEDVAQVGVHHGSDLRLHRVHRLEPEEDGADPLALLLVPDYDGEPGCLEEKHLLDLLRQVRLVRWLWRWVLRWLRLRGGSCFMEGHVLCVLGGSTNGLDFFDREIVEGVTSDRDIVGWG